MMDINILLIGDDINLWRTLRRFLLGHGYQVTLALDDRDAYDFVSRQCYDINILNLDFINTDIDGLIVCNKLREICISPILVLAADVNKEIRQKVLNGVADGFLEKPFSMEIFMAHVRAKLRLWSTIRSGTVEQSQRKVRNDIYIDPDRHEARIKEELIHLTPTEFKMLHYLASNEGRVVPHKELVNAVWGEQYGDEREYLRVYISQLRKKIEEDHTDARYLITEPGVGYRFVSDARYR
jgi:two-component system KDP operon response regulator KdpE